MPSAFRPRFFLPAVIGSPQPGALVSLSPADERHARVVLRARPEDPCEVVVPPLVASGPAASKLTASGAPAADPHVAGPGATAVGPPAPGRLFLGVFAAGEAGLLVRLLEEIPVRPPRLSLLLLQALPDLRSVDVLVEKGTEVGVDSFLLFAAGGSPPRVLERAAGRLERWRRIAEEAAKQSKQLSVPPVTLTGSLAQACESAADVGARLIMLEPRAPRTLGQCLTAAGAASGPRRLGLVVGPEGGWSESESELAGRLGLERAALGRRILRAETAGPVAAALARFALDDA